MKVKTLFTVLALAAMVTPAIAQTTKGKVVRVAALSGALESAITMQQASSDVTITITADKQQVRRNENVTLTVTAKNNLQPLPPISLQATATYQNVYGQTQTVQSNTVTLQVIQPVTVSTVNLAIPSGWTIVSGTNPINFNTTLNEGQTVSQSIVLRYGTPSNTSVVGP